MDKEIKKAFKKLVKLNFFLLDDMIFTWGEGSEKGIPNDKLFIGRLGAPRPDVTLTPYDIQKVEYTKPGLFKAGILTVVCVDGKNLNLRFKDKSNIKIAEKFNQCLALYKQYNLGK